MPLGLLYAVHGNLAALDAVLRDAESRGCDSFVLGGDYALFGPWPAETVERLRQLDAEWIRGNGERWTAHPNAAAKRVTEAVTCSVSAPFSNSSRPTCNARCVRSAPARRSRGWTR